ncbi:hypothetical protein niasHT_000027 [Heterodera trifolii]|uniref:Uncharacterized protein n=1 Tax=Heterodera trifolii TaxID=157864 RepID=A0ABD2M8M0_9BILA
MPSPLLPQDGKIVLNFALAERLPRARGCHNCFTTAVSGFMSMLSHKQRQLRRRTQQPEEGEEDQQQQQRRKQLRRDSEEDDETEQYNNNMREEDDGEAEQQQRQQNSQFITTATTSSSNKTNTSSKGRRRQEEADVDSAEEEQDLATSCVAQLREELVPGLFKLTSLLVAARPQLRPLAEHCGDGGEDIPFEFVNCICRVLSVIPALDEQIEQIRHQLLLILQQVQYYNYDTPFRAPI